ncbi:MAG TPA: DsbC family protein [Rhodocyclaceae bacterium]|nr:DsbC family protein [Rhodocyclaceae bacterium]
MKKTLTALALTSLAFNVAAGEAEIKKALEPRFGTIEKITRASIAGLWEVTAGGQIYYSDDKGGYAILGNLIDMKTGKNLTAERQFAALPLDLAIKQVRGSGKNVLVTFEDPNCGYCKKLATELLAIKDITVYTFLMPILSEDSFEKSKAIWCSPDRSKAWIDYMTANKAPSTADGKCDLTGLGKSVSLGRKLRINGTPALFFANGDRVGGYIPVEEVEKRFKGSGSVWGS